MLCTPNTFIIDTFCNGNDGIQNLFRQRVLEELEHKSLGLIGADFPICFRCCIAECLYDNCKNVYDGKKKINKIARNGKDRCPDAA